METWSSKTHTGISEPIPVVHGVSSQRMLWGWLLSESPHLTLVAPDLRGRGDSVDVTGPSSLARHADDLDAVMDALGFDTADPLLRKYAEHDLVDGTVRLSYPMSRTCSSATFDSTK